METLNTVGFHIDQIRERIKEISDDSEIQDLLIYSTLIDVRALLLDQELTSRKEVDENYYQTICVKLCKDTYANCCTNHNINKFVLKSVKALPDYITHKYIRPLVVTTIDGEQVLDYQKTRNLKWDKYWDSGYDELTYDVINFNNNINLVVHDDTFTLPEVLVTAAFTDPVSAGLYEDCSEGEDCLDWKDVSFPIPSKQRRTLWRMVVEDLTATKQEATDITENSQSTKQEY